MRDVRDYNISVVGPRKKQAENHLQIQASRHFSVKLRNSFKGKYFRHLTRVLVRLPETKGMSKFTVPPFSRGENVVHSSVEHM